MPSVVSRKTHCTCKFYSYSNFRPEYLSFHTNPEPVSLSLSGPSIKTKFQSSFQHMICFLTK